MFDEAWMVLSVLASTAFQLFVFLSNKLTGVHLDHLCAICHPVNIPEEHTTEEAQQNIPTEQDGRFSGDPPDQSGHHQLHLRFRFRLQDDVVNFIKGGPLKNPTIPLQDLIS